MNAPVTEPCLKSSHQLPLFLLNASLSLSKGINSLRETRRGRLLPFKILYLWKLFNGGSVLRYCIPGRRHKHPSHTHTHTPWSLNTLDFFSLPLTGIQDLRNRLGRLPSDFHGRNKQLISNYSLATHILPHFQQISWTSEIINCRSLRCWHNR